MVTFTPVPYSESLHGHLPKTQQDIIKSGEFWESSDFLVIRRKLEGAGLPCPVWHLSMRNRDNLPITWRDAQLVKNSMVGPEHEGCEILPAESEKVDVANQYHLWVFSDPKVRLPFGFGRTSGVQWHD